MLKHLIKSSVRKLLHNQLTSIGSIVTVISGVLCISLIYAFVHNELTINDFHKKKDRIYMFLHKDSKESLWEPTEPRTYFKFAPHAYPEIKKLTSIRKYPQGEIKVSFADRTFSPETLVADSLLFQVFDFPLLVGDKKTIFREPDAVILTKRMSQKLFGNKDPIGKNIKITTNREKTFTIKGIAENPPANSSITYDLIAVGGLRFFSRMGAEFILVDESFDRETFLEKVKKDQLTDYEGNMVELNVLSLDEIYNNEGAIVLDLNIFSKVGDKKVLYLLIGIILIIFIITTLNLLNLQIISINSDIKEIGVKKVNGATKYHLIYQKLIEILFLVILSTIFVTLTFLITLPYFTSILKMNLTPSPIWVLTVNFIILSIAALLSIIYPAAIVFNISVHFSLKKDLHHFKNLFGKKVIMISQLSFSIMLIIASIVIFKQLNLMLEKDPGFTTENIITVKMFHNEVFFEDKEEMFKKRKEKEKAFQYLINQLSKSPYIKGFTQGSSPLQSYTMTWKPTNTTHDYTSEKLQIVSPSYASVLELEVVQGRFFDKDKDQSRGDAVVINEAAMKLWGLRNIEDGRLLNKTWNNDNGFEIIGVVKDFNFQHLSFKPQPLMMLYFFDPDRKFLIKFEKGAMDQGIEQVQKLFSELNPNQTFSYSVLEEEWKDLYQKEKRLSYLILCFTVVAFLITSTGLFIIALSNARQKTKEIGIRKVNGARVFEIIKLLNLEFIVISLLAFIISAPIAYFAMNKWLENFAYRTELSWWIFALAGMIALGIALLTVSWQSWRAATRNPVEALRYE